MRTKDSRLKLTMLIGTSAFSTMMLAWAAASHKSGCYYRAHGCFVGAASAKSSS